MVGLDLTTIIAAERGAKVTTVIRQLVKAALKAKRRRR
jgi:hypothetical protein